MVEFSYGAMQKLQIATVRVAVQQRSNALGSREPALGEPRRRR
jgi:hypothetical protein